MGARDKRDAAKWVARGLGWIVEESVKAEGKLTPAEIIELTRKDCARPRREKLAAVEFVLCEYGFRECFFGHGMYSHRPNQINAEFFSWKRGTDNLL